MAGSVDFAEDSIVSFEGQARKVSWRSKAANSIGNVLCDVIVEHDEAAAEGIFASCVVPGDEGVQFSHIVLPKVAVEHVHDATQNHAELEDVLHRLVPLLEFSLSCDVGRLEVERFGTAADERIDPELEHDEGQEAATQCDPLFCGRKTPSSVSNPVVRALDAAWKCGTSNDSLSFAEPLADVPTSVDEKLVPEPLAHA